MLTRWDADRTVVGRLRYSARRVDRFDAHARLGAAMGGLSVRASELPPSAILCVRRLAQPLPGSAGRGTGSIDESARGVATALNRLARAAARPAFGFVPANAEAVLFADPAELLAALAADWGDGVLHLHWWWRYLVAGGGDAGVVAREWAAQPHYVPAALAHLVREDRAANVLRALTPEEARAVTGAVANAIGVAAQPLIGVVHAIADPSRAVVRSETAAARLAAAPGQHVTEADAAPLPGGEAPWQRVAPEASDPVLPQAHQILVGLGLAFHRAPHLVRDSSFVPRVVAWRRDDESHRWQSGHTPAEAEVDRVIDGAPAIEAREPSQAADPHAPVPLRESRRGGHAPLRESSLQPQTAIAPDVMPHDSSHVEGGSPALVAAAPDASAVREAEAHREDVATPPSFVETRYGGVFYLVNVALALELYGDFTTPARPGLPLSIWDFLTLAGIDLLGAGFEADPVAPLLARLARRSPGDPPGKDFRPDEPWKVPRSWLSAFPERDGWTWSGARGRLTIRHPGGFSAVDLPIAPGVTLTDQLAAELAAFDLSPPEVTRRATSRVDLRGRPVRRWIQRLMPYLRARLGRALGVPPDRAGSRLCAQNARVHVSPSHLDVVFPLAELPVAVRVAGLDRNPGWVPAAERVIAFHYE